ncbi:hypothetical protein LIER_08840 [Lithospermum erythrorhizon]|uniref:Receptor-like serine/threonine-protein kinase n=1 Tax=Lithospermum erythrorhizon TaxID=34254 RepID=A0AAV3PHT9_LITER
MPEGNIYLSACFMFFMSVWLLVCSADASVIRLESKLSMGENNSWVSSNGNFAIGFFRRGNQFSVGIRYNSVSIPESFQEVVWVAGCDSQVSGESHFELTENGELVLYDSGSGKIVWASNTTNASVTSAILRDDGNLVLINKNEDIVWQSFDTPCDTLLPGQNLSVSMSLRPHKSDGLSSYYSLYMNMSGELQLRWEASVIYWGKGEDSRPSVRAMLSSNGIFAVFDQTSRSVWSAYGTDHSDSDILFRFLRLDSDGNLRLYSWLDASKSWRIAWQAVGNQCEVFATCSLQGICVLDESGFHICRCPFSSIGQPSKCLIPYQQNCRSGSSMTLLGNTILYGIYPSNETIIHTNLNNCRSVCQEDPSCIAVSFVNDGTAECRLKRTQYISGWSDASLNVVSFFKTCSDPIATLPPKSNSSEQQKSSESKSICVRCLIGGAAGTFFLFVFIHLGVGVFIWRRTRHFKKQPGQTYAVPYYKGCVALSYSEISDMTENFKHQIGPKMHRGHLHDNKPVAVKTLDASIEEKIFRNRVSKLGSISHKSLVKLDGYCCDSNQRFIVYEFVKNGCLKKYLQDPKLSKKLPWEKRINICVTVAKAVSYLHTECREFVSHGNLKCENVVLDHNFEAKVSEFGLKSVTGNISDIEEKAENDVNDFGKIVIEVISGRTYDHDLCEWAYEKLIGAETDSIRDARMDAGVNSDELERALRIAFWCLQEDARMRPSMGEVVQVLEGTVTVDSPTYPFGKRHQSLPEESPESSPEVLNESIV